MSNHTQCNGAITKVGGEPIRQGVYTFFPCQPTYSGCDGQFGDFGTYLDWQGIVDKIESKLRPPRQRPVIILGRNGSGKDALAVEIARRLKKPLFLTTLTRQTTAASLVMTQRLPLESREVDLSPHTSAQITGGLSVLTEGGKADSEYELPLTAQSPAYDGHRRLVWDSPNFMVDIHPEHALLILALPGETIQGDIRSRAAVYRLEMPPPDVLIQIVKAGMDVQADILLAALQAFLSDRQAANKPVSPRAARDILSDAWKDSLALRSTRLSAQEAERLIRTAAEHVDLTF